MGPLGELIAVYVFRPGGLGGPEGADELQMSRRVQPLQNKLRAFYESSDLYEAWLAAAPKERFADYAEMLCRVSAPGDLVLDGGCGVGQVLELLAESGRRPIGVDISQRFLAAASRGSSAVAAADLAHLPFPDGSFNLVGFYQVVEHLPDVAGAVRELLRVTQPGGTLVTYVPNYFAVTKNRMRARLAKGRGVPGPQWLHTLWEAVRGAWMPLTKLSRRHPQPRYLRPLIGSDWHDADYDTVAALHPLDVLCIVRDEGCSAALHPSPSDSWWRRVARGILWHFGPGWWVVVRKPHLQI